MGKARRSGEENKRINIATIIILVIMLVSWLFLLIYLLFAKAETKKEIKSTNDEIETIKLETSILNEKKEEMLG